MVLATDVAALDRRASHRAPSGLSGSDAQPASNPHIVQFIIAFLFCVMNAFPAGAQEVTNTPLWHTVDVQGQRHVHAYVFWSRTCPHCKKAIRFLHRLESTHPWLRLYT